jgi:four helix bundle protein
MNSQPQKNQQPHEYSVQKQPRTAMFDHERLHVYQFELQFIAWVTPLIEEARNTATARVREVCDQLDRASLSALLNTAEGNGKRQGQSRAKFFDDARGSATECAACLDAMVAKAVFPANRVLNGKEILVQIVNMLCALVDRFDGGAHRFREEEVSYRTHAAQPNERGSEEEEDKDEEEDSN